MKILLLISSFNSLSQKVYVRLKEQNHIVSIKYAIDNKLMIEEVKSFKPDIILCPFLNKFVPKEIYENTATFIVHPGIIGDRGANSLDLAILEDKKQWGVVVLKANEEFDGGDIYSFENFSMPNKSKASIYRNEVTNCAIKAIDKLFINLQDSSFSPIKQVLNPLHKKITQEDRKINWEKDSSSEIIKKINASDSSPGVKETLLGLPCYMYGAFLEEELKGKPKQIVAKRDGAICIGTIDKAVWITHLKEENYFKLPTTYVLKDRLKGVVEKRVPLVLTKHIDTFYELRVEKEEEIAYLYFNFHNGAMSTAQCIRLKYAIDYLKEECKVLVLMGGEDFFSNGIHLNILEDSKKQGEDGWSNINAINDIIKSLIFSSEIITVTSFGKNAGAGGVFLGLASDYIVINEEVVLNPHYKTLGLSGSEYHSFTLPKRVGELKAKEIINKCLPLGSSEAKNIGLVDKVFKNENYLKELKEFCKDLLKDEDSFDEFCEQKEEFLEENAKYINSCKEKELKQMYDEFWKEESLFHILRKEFVYKKQALKTPQRLKEI
ncbi:hydrogenase [Malaciobacter mytili LMG 24559]|uniref:Hydrogenase n=1 Tax=Malaciobacter mytili LMG 24559 TaxID=1032238 RepID=A0AAX2AKK1_9BACT|nr:hydrogenase maturation protein [Malaciobacter mytili]AXH14814.1 [Ni-Fe] hydrogenase maturation protein HypX [Malaciobacter mytili LMG 24559]RXK16815.1 hydrogenase [Malaciobacter mytili LMG 24559]